MYLVSTPALWDVQMSGNNLWFRPLTKAAPGSKTGITVVLESGEEFDFTALEASYPPAPCYYVLDDATRLTGVQAGLDDGSEVGKLKEAYRKATAEAEAVTASAALRSSRPISPTVSSATTRALTMQQTKEIARQVEDQASDAIRHFQMSVHTGYEWTEPKNDRVLVDAVYDDGRFTYIRVKSSGFGTPAIYAVNEDDAYMVDYAYDDLTGVYRVNGLYDAMRVRLDTKKIDIVRRR